MIREAVPHALIRTRPLAGQSSVRCAPILGSESWLPQVEHLHRSSGAMGSNQKTVRISAVITHVGPPLDLVEFDVAEVETPEWTALRIEWEVARLEQFIQVCEGVDLVGFVVDGFPLDAGVAAGEWWPLPWSPKSFADRTARDRA